MAADIAAAAPLSLAEAKAFLRVESAAEDALIAGLIRTAAALCEAFIGQPLADDWNAVPEPLRQGILRLVAHLFTSRDAPDDAGPPAAVAALWRPWRRMRLG